MYDKHQNDEKIWVENIGPLFEQGTVTKFYNQYNLLVLEKTFLDNLKVHYKEYYEYSGKLSSEYTSYFTADGSTTGKYMAYFENGKVQTIGQFYDGDFTNIINNNLEFTVQINEIGELILHYIEQPE